MFVFVLYLRTLAPTILSYDSPNLLDAPFLGLRRDSSTWAVYFGVLPGIVHDPMAEPDGKGDAAFVLAQQDPRRGTETGSGTESVGTVELIALAAEAEGPMPS